MHVNMSNMYTYDYNCTQIQMFDTKCKTIIQHIKIEDIALNNTVGLEIESTNSTNTYCLCALFQ